MYQQGKTSFKKCDTNGTVQTLNGKMGTGGGNVPMVMEAKAVGSFYPQMKAESQCYRDDDKSNTLVNGTNPGYQNAVVYVLDRASFNQGKNAKYDFSVKEEQAQTLVSRGPGGVFTKR